MFHQKDLIMRHLKIVLLASICLVALCSINLLSAQNGGFEVVGKMVITTLNALQVF